MICVRCRSNRVVHVGGKCSDRFYAELGDLKYDGYVPSDLGIGFEDTIHFAYCLDCGQIDGNFPRRPTELERINSRDDDD